MFKHPVKKFIALTALYGFIIVGIFFLQFRNESVLAKNSGMLRVSLAQTQQPDGTISLKNSLQVSFDGISFSSDEFAPAKITVSEQNKIENLTLVSYEQPTPLSYRFNFVDESGETSSVVFAVSDTSEKASLTVLAELADNASEISFPYKPASGFTVTKKFAAKEIISSKNKHYSLAAARLDDDSLTLTRLNQIALYTEYNPSSVFSFTSIPADSPFAQEATYESLMASYREKLVGHVIDSFKTPSQISEPAVAAYVSQMLLDGKYRDSVSQVPDSFKKGNRMTYLTTPFFGSLEAMNTSLQAHNQNMREMVLNALESGSPNIFANEDFAEYVYFAGSTENIKKLLSLPSKIAAEKGAEEKTEEEALFTVAQSFGILHTYLRLKELKSDLADLLENVLSSCVSSIQSKCVLGENGLSIVENDVPASPLLALETGATLLEYGSFTHSQELKTAGFALTNTALSQNLDIITMATAYPIVAKNPYYPHYAVLYRQNGKNIWAWTASDRIVYEEKGGVGIIRAKFPVGETQHLIIAGIQPFGKIEIYNMPYHSDVRFERYNTSGFNYRDKERALFIKSRHKAEYEQISLYYGE
ncbi:MAG: hypothetical protein II921_01470 [Treponema sp.]|nr:hypothetical protein [Treponema sp.]